MLFFVCASILIVLATAGASVAYSEYQSFKPRFGAYKASLGQYERKKGKRFSAACFVYNNHLALSKGFRRFIEHRATVTLKDLLQRADTKFSKPCDKANRALGKSSDGKSAGALFQSIQLSVDALLERLSVTPDSIGDTLALFLQHPSDEALEKLVNVSVFPAIVQMTLNDEMLLKMQAQKIAIGTDDRVNAVIRALRSIGLPNHVSPRYALALERLMMRYYDELQTDIVTFFEGNPGNDTDEFVPNVSTNLKMTICSSLTSIIANGVDEDTIRIGPHQPSSVSSTLAPPLAARANKQLLD